MAGREPEPLIATDYVIDELLTLLKVRGEYARAEALGGALLRENIAEIHWVTPDDVFAAVQLVLLAMALVIAVFAIASIPSATWNQSWIHGS